jgi:hypothetical protein
MKDDFIKQISLKKVGTISLIVSTFIVTYYILGIYKTYLEIKELKKIDDE